MNKKAKLEAAKNRLKSGARSAGKTARCVGNAAWKGLNSKPGRAAIAAGAAGVARLALPVHPVGAIVVLAVTTGVQVWAMGVEMS